MKVITFIVGVFFAAHAFALQYQYECTVKSELALDSEGYLKAYPIPVEVGSVFSVDRVSGKIIGKPFTNIRADSVRVLDEGSSEQSFKVLSLSMALKGEYNTGFLIIDEFQKAEYKPFVGQDGTSTIYSGLCK